MSNIRKWTIDMDADCVYGTAGFKQQKSQSEVKHLITLLIARSQLFENIEVLEITPIKRIIKLWDDKDALCITSTKRNNKNEIIFIASNLATIDFTWETIKSMAMEIKGH